MKKIILIVKEKGFKYVFFKVLRKIYLKLKIIYEIIYFYIFEKNIEIKTLNKNSNNFISYKENILNEYNKNNHIKEKVLLEAKSLLEDNYKFLGININLSKNIEWNKDFNNNYIWKNKYYKLINLNSKNSNDIKIPWEFSRLYFLITLGKAYLITNEYVYYEKFKFIIEDWDLNNPYKQSVNWTCSMEVAIRAVNIIVAKEFFEEIIDNDLESKINILLYKHGKFIYNNLENYEPKSNHYISDLIGLFWLGVYFEKNTEIKKWLDFSIKELNKEIIEQINEDGTDYEGATSYHKLVLELLLLTMIYGNKNNIIFEDFFCNKVKLMCNFLLDIIKPNYKIPLIGDNDDGRLLILSSYYEWDKRDPRYLLNIAAYYFDDENYYFNDYNILENIFLLFNQKKQFVQKEYRKKCISYEEGGYYILKNNNFYCLIRCGELSMRGHGGHSHNEQLSIEININGIDIFIDPGAYVYTSDYEKRNKFRSTLMHNTVQIEDEEQNKFDYNNIFLMKERTFSKCINFKDNTFVGCHYGYIKRFNCKHYRSVKMIEDQIIINDLFENNIDKKTINFILPELLNLKVENNKVIIDNLCKLTFEGKPKIQETDYSISYGVLKKGKRIYVETSKKEYKILINLL
ncbi:alginate lyase family protein [Clostridium perfringens]